MNYLYTEDQLDKLERLLSLERLSKYTSLSFGDRSETIKLYEANTRLSEAFYTPLQGLEVCLRNSMSLELVAFLGITWFENNHGIFEGSVVESIDKAKEEIIKDGKSVNSQNVIAELNFGFWSSILGPRYDTSLWTPAIRKAFPCRPKTHQRKETQGAINAIRRLRNRIAHHEPIVHRKLRDDHKLILQLISWCCPETANWVLTNSRFPKIIEAEGDF